MTAAREQGDHFQVGDRVQLSIAGRGAVGTVVEALGALAHDGGQLVRVQLDWADVAEPVELQVPAAAAARRAMSEEDRKAFREALSRGSERRRSIVSAAVEVFRDSLRHVAMGMWPEHLAQHVREETGGEVSISVSEATATLDELATVHAVVKLRTGIYVSTNWLLELLDTRSQPATPSRARTSSQRGAKAR